jgi:hypothetical protein
MDKLIAMYLPDTTPAFKTWIAGEMNKIDEEHQQQQKGGSTGSSSACPATPGARPASPRHRVDAGSSNSKLPTRAAVGLTATIASADTLTGLAALPDASRAAAAAAGGMGPTMEALKLRMSQLQSEKNRMLSASKHAATTAASGPAGGALSPVSSVNLPEAGVMSKGVAGGAPPTAVTGNGSDGGICVKVAAGHDVAGAAGVAGMNLQELKSRMKAWQGSHDS